MLLLILNLNKKKYSVDSLPAVIFVNYNNHYNKVPLYVYKDGNHKNAGRKAKHMVSSIKMTLFLNQ